MNIRHTLTTVLVLSASFLLIPSAWAVSEDSTSTVNATMAEQFNMPAGRTFDFNVNAIDGSPNNYQNIQVDIVNGADWSIESNKLEPVDIAISTTQEYTDGSGVVHPYVLLSGTSSRDTADNNNYMDYAVSYITCGGGPTLDLIGDAGNTGSGQIPVQNQLITTCQGSGAGTGPGELMVRRVPTNVSGSVVEPLGGSYTGQFTITATQA